MAASLLALISGQGVPQLPTQKALIILGPQNDLLGPSGKLPVVHPDELVNELASLVPAFRDFGLVIWVRLAYDASNSPKGVEGVSISAAPHRDRRASSKSASPKSSSLGKGHRRVQSRSDVVEVDDELFLSKNRRRGPCCIFGSKGADYHPRTESLLDRKRDLQVVTNRYSALQGTNLLQTLRMRFVTSVYLAGCVSNLSIYATALDAAQYGISATIIEDCTGYCSFLRHQVAMKRLKTLVGARLITWRALISSLRQPLVDPDDEDASGNGGSEESSAESATTSSSTIEPGPISEPSPSISTVRASARRFQSALAAMDTDHEAAVESDRSQPELAEADVLRALAQMRSNIRQGPSRSSRARVTSASAAEAPEGGTIKHPSKSSRREIQDNHIKRA